MLGHADGPHARPAAPVRYAKSLVQIQVANIRADEAGRGEPDLGIHVGSIHVHLAAVGMDNGADVHDGGFEYAVRAGIGHHETGQILCVRRRLGLQIRHINVAVPIAGHRNDFHPCHGRARRVGAVRRGGDQANIPVLLAARFMVGADDQQAGVFALRAGIRLQGNSRKARDGFQPVFQVLEQDLVTSRLP